MSTRPPKRPPTPPVPRPPKVVARPRRVEDEEDSESDEVKPQRRILKNLDDGLTSDEHPASIILASE